MLNFLSNLHVLGRTALIIIVALAAHFAVYLVRIVGERLTAAETTASIRKLRTLVILGTSVTVNFEVEQKGPSDRGPRRKRR